jgi:hypothetical protein
MQLVIDGDLRCFTPIREFHKRWGLPETFGVTTFEASETLGLKPLDRVSDEINLVRQAVLDAIPHPMPLHEWLAYLPNLTQILTHKLHEIAVDIHLKAAEIDSLAAEFEAACQCLVYALIRARAAQQTLPDFDQVYHAWLSENLRISSRTYSYIYGSDVWAIQIVRTAFGFAGLIIWTENATYYVQDTRCGGALGGFMNKLLSEVGARLILAAGSASSQDISRQDC